MTRDPIEAATDAQKVLDEFLTPAFEAVNDTYVARLAQIAASEPWDTDKIAKLAIAVRVAQEVRAQIEAVVTAGKLAAAEHLRAEKIERIPLAKRKYMGVGIHAQK